MTKAQVQAKMDALQNEIDKIEEDYIPKFEEKKQAIEDKAYDRDSGENTEKEQEKIEKIESQINALEEVRDALQEAKDKYEELLETYE